MEKLNTEVAFPYGRNGLLNLTKNFFTRDQNKRIEFKLVAVCAHSGDAVESGHYVAYVPCQSPQGGPEQWARIDGTAVAVIHENVFFQQTLKTAYLLFYSQVIQ